MPRPPASGAPASGAPPSPFSGGPSLLSGSGITSTRIGPGDVQGTTLLRAAQRIVSEGAGMRADERAAHFATVFPDFARDVPKLFAMVCQDGADLTHLKFMLNRLNAMDAGHETHDAAFQRVAGRLVAKYVDPLVERAKREGLDPTPKAQVTPTMPSMT
jgi:hypothetical protein